MITYFPLIPVKDLRDIFTLNINAPTLGQDMQFVVCLISDIYENLNESHAFLQFYLTESYLLFLFNITTTVLLIAPEFSDLQFMREFYTCMGVMGHLLHMKYDRQLRNYLFEQESGRL